MTIIKEKKKVDEFLDLKNFDKIRTTGSLSAWQRNIYNLITKRLASTVLDKMMQYVNKNTPEDVDREELKNTVRVALLDYIDSVL
ncbi:MAG TPA: hypothetical protein DHS57_00995 [Erysipelotrichaceae bacterium]|nr:hypothetical protein [Erysipelotrichaceae bacterium]